MKLGSNITVNNVLQVYVTTSMIFYAISLQKVRTSHTLKQEYGNTCSSKHEWGILTVKRVMIQNWKFSVPQIAFAAEYKVVMYTTCCKLSCCCYCDATLCYCDVRHAEQHLCETVVQFVITIVAPWQEVYMTIGPISWVFYSRYWELSSVRKIPMGLDIDNDKLQHWVL